MKCIQSIGRPSVIRRVDDELAASYVKAGKYNYCSKSLWKTEVRDAVKEDTSAPEVKEAVEASEKPKGHKKYKRSFKGKARKSGK